MVNARREIQTCLAVLLLAAAVLTGAAWNRGAEYDEQYTLFVTSGTPRPIWPAEAFPAGLVRTVQAGHADFGAIAQDLRRTDVHPPLYFWLAACWRLLVGDGLFEMRLLSVVFGLGALIAIGIVARQCGIPPAMAMLLTAGCYGFAYTAAIARGFALAQLLTLLGLMALLGRRRVLAGMLLGGAVATNFLAAFVCGALIVGSRRGRWWIVLGLVPGLSLAVWFFLAQRGTRTGQFPPFECLSGLIRLARYAAANLTGGLPVYVPDMVRSVVAGALAVGLLALFGLVARRWRRIATVAPRRLLALASVAPPAGLMALGFIFDNTPIELRYLAFATPFVALLVAGARPPRAVLGLILGVQAASICGLILRGETMQPATATAIAASTWVGQGAVLLPRGNDGVGIVGAFAASVPPATPLLIVDPADTAAQIGDRLTPFHRIVVAALGQDGDSRAALPTMEIALRGPGWREIGRGFNIVAYQRVDRTDE